MIKRYPIRNDQFYTPKLILEQNNDNNDIVPGFEVNKKFKYDQNLMIKAIQNGMILNILYKRKDDRWKGGTERVICPMNLGINKNTKNTLLRAWHLEGYSKSNKGEAKKIWRLFIADQKHLKSMTFTGDFMRLPPKGYKMNDRIMTEKTIQRANFNEVRRNQNKLIQANKIEAEEQAQINDKVTIAKIQVDNTGQEINLREPWNNPILEKQQNNPNLVKISVLKSIIGNEFICVVGAIGTIGRSVKVYENNSLIGTYKCLDAFTGDEFQNHKSVRNVSQMPLFTFQGKKK